MGSAIAAIPVRSLGVRGGARLRQPHGAVCTLRCLSVFAAKVPWEKKPRVWATADTLATVVGLDMTTHWSPTVRSYLGRVSKNLIVSAVREAVGTETAERIVGMKKDAMAEAAERLLAGTGWLPAVLRTPVAESVPAAEISQSGAALAPEAAYTVAAE
jgi:ParB family chromosome partitioning protein